MSNEKRPETDEVKKSALHARLNTWQSLLFSVVVMGLLIAIVILFKVPNPNMVLIAGLVVCSALTGYTGGGAAAVIMFIYTLYFFSTGHDFLTFTGENMKKVLVSLFGILVDMLFVCELKKRELAYSRKVESLTEELQNENKMLQEMSMIDGLTGIRNRLALRHDYPSYRGQHVFVMMMDLDNFKSINDEFGHDEGDRMLMATGKLLAERFGRRSCYRYGGDEFLVISMDTDEHEFVGKIKSMIDQRPVVGEDPNHARLDYSVGYAEGTVEKDYALRTLFATADDRMYRAKRTGHNLIIGEEEQ